MMDSIVREKHNYNIAYSKVCWNYIFRLKIFSSWIQATERFHSSSIVFEIPFFALFQRFMIASTDGIYY